jgi:hypothetical protein
VRRNAKTPPSAHATGTPLLRSQDGAQSPAGFRLDIGQISRRARYRNGLATRFALLLLTANERTASFEDAGWQTRVRTRNGSKARNTMRSSTLNPYKGSSGQVRSFRFARWWMRFLAAMGFAGVGFQAYGVSRNMGGWRDWSKSVLNGPPLPAGREI